MRSFVGMASGIIRTECTYRLKLPLNCQKNQDFRGSRVRLVSETFHDAGTSEALHDRVKVYYINIGIFSTSPDLCPALIGPDNGLFAWCRKAHVGLKPTLGFLSRAVEENGTMLGCVDFRHLDVIGIAERHLQANIHVQSETNREVQDGLLSGCARALAPGSGSRTIAR